MYGWADGRSSSFVTDIEWICLWHWATDEESTDDETMRGRVNIVLEEKTNSKWTTDGINGPWLDFLINTDDRVITVNLQETRCLCPADENEPPWKTNIYKESCSCSCWPVDGRRPCSIRSYIRKGWCCMEEKEGNYSLLHNISISFRALNYYTDWL